MNTDPDITGSGSVRRSSSGVAGMRVWPVGALLHAIADTLESRFNPIAIQGEISGFSRATSGHCYFSLKDEQGQVRCAMFRRAASLLGFSPRDGQWVELRGRLGVYEPRGELQMVVESMQQTGQGNLFEQFLLLKARLDAEGLFDAHRKRALPLIPACVGVVTSLGAAALHDVVTALRRRAPHVRVVIYPASVQGSQAAGELRDALRQAYARAEVDVLLLVRGGGAMEDLWAFNDEQLARVIVESPVPLISGVGHETDFTIADFCADLRAPTPTAAAELCAQPRQALIDMLVLMVTKVRTAVDRQLENDHQRLDRAASRVARPSHFLTKQHARLSSHVLGLRHAMRPALAQRHALLAARTEALQMLVGHIAKVRHLELEHLQLRLEAIDPARVLTRGYSWLTDAEGQAITSVSQTRTGQAVRAILVDGEVDLTVSPRRLL